MEVFRQLELLEDHRFREVCMPSIGPVFPAGASRRAIAEEFHRDLEAMGKTAWVDPSSPFIVQAMRLLTELKESGKEAEEPALRVPAQTQMEEWIELALGFSLGISHDSVGHF